MRFRPIDRDDGLRRVSRLTRWLMAGAVGLLGVLSALVASALPGSSGTTSGTAQPSTPTNNGTVNVPSPQATAPPQTSQTTPNTTDPNLAPAPPPVSSHHQSVTNSGGT